MLSWKEIEQLHRDIYIERPTIYLEAMSNIDLKRELTLRIQDLNSQYKAEIELLISCFQVVALREGDIKAGLEFASMLYQFPDVDDELWRQGLTRSFLSTLVSYIDCSKT
jgi:hypothetical protein